MCWFSFSHFCSLIPFSPFRNFLIHCSILIFRRLLRWISVPFSVHLLFLSSTHFDSLIVSLYSLPLSLSLAWIFLPSFCRTAFDSAGNLQTNEFESMWREKKIVSKYNKLWLVCLVWCVQTTKHKEIATRKLSERSSDTRYEWEV